MIIFMFKYPKKINFSWIFVDIYVLDCVYRYPSFPWWISNSCSGVFRYLNVLSRSKNIYISGFPQLDIRVGGLFPWISGAQELSGQLKMERTSGAGICGLRLRGARPPERFSLSLPPSLPPSSPPLSLPLPLPQPPSPFSLSAGHPGHPLARPPRASRQYPWRLTAASRASRY